jgi:DNA-binding NtrC family response regulator
MLRESFRELLENDGYRTLAVVSGAEALSSNRAHQGELDFLIASLDFDVTNGIDLAIEIVDGRPNLQVVFTTTASPAEKSQCVLCEKAKTHFLFKPFLYSQLRSKLEQLSALQQDTLEWLLHLYDQQAKPPVLSSTQLEKEENDELHPITVRLQTVERGKALVARGLLRKPHGVPTECLIEVQINTKHSWRGLQLMDLESMVAPAVRLVVCVEEQAETLSCRPPGPSQDPDEIVPLEQLEKKAIMAALTKVRGNKVLAAKSLGIGMTTMYRKLRHYGITVDHAPHPPHGILKMP